MSAITLLSSTIAAAILLQAVALHAVSCGYKVPKPPSLSVCRVPKKMPDPIAQIERYGAICSPSSRSNRETRQAILQPMHALGKSKRRTAQSCRGVYERGLCCSSHHPSQSTSPAALVPCSCFFISQSWAALQPSCWQGFIIFIQRCSVVLKEKVGIDPSFLVS